MNILVSEPARGYRAYREEIDRAINEALEGGAYILGPAVRRFEAEWAAWSGSRGGMVGVASGTDALHLALRTLGIGSGDVVLTVSHTAVATVAAVELAGAVPVLVDVDEDTFTIDVNKLHETIVRLRASGSCGQPKAVIGVHLYGHPCDINAIRRICDEHELLLIEDCAQAHGAAIDGRPVGTWGEAAAFSFYPTKNLAALGDAGAVSFASARDAERCRALREYGWRHRYVSETAGLNSRLDEVQAAVLCVRLRHLDEEIRKRRSLASFYQSRLNPRLRRPAIRPGAEHAFHLYVVRTAARRELQHYLAGRGVGTGIHYPVPVHRQPAYLGRVPIGEGGMAITESIAEEVLSLPMHPFLTDEESEWIVASLDAWFSRGGVG